MYGYYNTDKTEQMWREITLTELTFWYSPASLTLLACCIFCTLTTLLTALVAVSFCR